MKIRRHLWKKDDIGAEDDLILVKVKTCYLSLLCYNFGVETYELKRYEQSSFWLSHSYEIGKTDKKYSPGKEMLAIVLLLLATVYSEWDYKQYQDKALRAIHMANEAKHYSESLQWYNYSLSLYSSGQIAWQNLGKLHRNMAACYLHLKVLDKAKEAVTEAERYDSNSIFTQFYVYKIAVLENNTQKALDAFVAMEKSAAHPSHHEDKLLTDRSMATNLLSLAAQFALENDQQSVAIKALGYLSQHLQDCQQAFTALKCLIRLVLSKVAVKSEEITEDMKSLSTYLTGAHHRLDGLFREENGTLEMRVSEAQWFRKIAWNLAVQCENCPRIMRDFFIMSFKFSQFCPPDKAILLAQRTCLLMAAAVNLDIGRSSLLPADQQTELLTQALEHIQSCREIWKVLRQAGDFPKDPTDILLLLYEFEARAKLNDPMVANLLDQVWELPHVEIKTLETIASLAMEPPAHYPSVCKKALKMVLTLLRKREDMDTVTFSKCLHSLVHLSLPSGTIEADVCALEEPWSYFEDALSILGSTVLQASYPEVEILWLMTRAWNTGIYQYCAGRYKEAEQWCSLGMRFLAHLGTLKSSYESQMIGLYSEVLDKLDRAKGFHPKEE